MASPEQLWGIDAGGVGARKIESLVHGAMDAEAKWVGDCQVPAGFHAIGQRHWRASSDGKHCPQAQELDQNCAKDHQSHLQLG